MNLIEPHRFTPFEAGNATSVTLPGRHRSTHVDVLRINDGLVLAHSHFSPAARHDDDIRRPEDQLILAFNLSGRMLLIDRPGRTHEIAGGQAWIIRCGGPRMKRVVEKGEGCSNLVVAVTVSQLNPQLAELCQRALPGHAPFRRLRLPVPGRAVLDTLLDGRADPAALLRKEGQCLALVGHALEELAAAPRPYGTAGDPALLAERPVVRGMSAFDNALYDPVGYLVNGVPLPLGTIQLPHFFGAESVTLLKGPQGTTFGRNSEAGLLSFDTIAPGSREGGEIRLGLSGSDTDWLAAM